MATPPTIVGVDPGGHDTGIVARSGVHLLARETVTRAKGQSLDDYLEAILDELDEIVTCALLDRPYAAAGVLVAVEAVNAPTGHARGRAGHIINPAGLLDTAAVYGAIRTSRRTSELARRVITVPPGGNGQQPLALYPPELLPERGSGKGHDKRRHERSAWDVAGVAALIARSVPAVRR